MSRSVVGLLAAAGAIMAALVGFVHGDFVPAMIACSGTATGLAAWFALPKEKKPAKYRYEHYDPDGAGLAQPLNKKNLFAGELPDFPHGDFM